MGEISDEETQSSAMRTAARPIEEGGPCVEHALPRKRKNEGSENIIVGERSPPRVAERAGEIRPSTSVEETVSDDQRANGAIPPKKRASTIDGFFSAALSSTQAKPRR